MDLHLKRHRSPDGDGEEDELEITATDEDVFTIDEAIDSCGFGWFQVKLSVFSGLIWVVDAMEIMVLSILSPAARCEFQLQPYEEGLITTVVFVGMLFGAGFWGAVMDKYGRKRGLFIISVGVCIFALISAFSFSYWFLLLSRGLVGFAIAGGAQAVTFYSEFLPTKNRAYCLILIEFFFAFGTFFEVVLAIFVMQPSSGHDDSILNVTTTLMTPIANSTLALETPNGGNWRYLLGFTTVPLVLDLFAFLFVPESPRYYIACGKLTKALNVLEQVARSNKKSLPPGRLVSKGEKEMIMMMRATNNTTLVSGDADETAMTMMGIEDQNEEAQESDDQLLAGKRESVSQDEGEDPERLLISTSTALAIEPKKESRGRFLDLFSTTERIKTTLLLWNIWFAAAFGYYGIVLLTTEVLTIIDELTVSNLTDGSYMPCYDHSTQRNDTICALLDLDDYKQVLWTTAAELPGILLTAFIVERIGRKKTMAIEFGGCVVAFFLMYICPINKIALMFLIFVVRALITGAFQAAYVYTPEVYPTAVRAVGLGMCSTIARLGAMITPFIAQVLLRTSIRGGEGTYAGACLMATVCALLLPIETMGKGMRDNLNVKKAPVEEEQNSSKA
ncbi:putative transporter svop-1 [Oscarella lobularis]|uniref:putative transporter svop-1 n=1 Tax=Oscarella lobularis TaxID=121494 RepID=UPI00331418BD